MVNHPNRRKKLSVSPSTVLQEAARAVGAPITLLWEIPGPKDTSSVWLSCYAFGTSICIVQTYDDGGWESFTPNSTNDAGAMIADVFTRCGVPQTA